MYAAHAHSAYQAQAVETAPPAQLVLMMYDGTLTALTRAEQAIARRDVEESNAQLQKAQRIIDELVVSLDMEQGGAIAQNLLALYNFCLDQLLEANLRKDAAGIPAVRDAITCLRDAWEQACTLAPVVA
jgi:flagellar secretion chaperone FliS